MQIGSGDLQPHIQWVPGEFLTQIKRPGREADHSCFSNAEVTNEWNYKDTFLYSVIACAVKALF
jgi:hypothetical protein